MDMFTKHILNFCQGSAFERSTAPAAQRANSSRPTGPHQEGSWCKYLKGNPLIIVEMRLGALPSTAQRLEETLDICL